MRALPVSLVVHGARLWDGGVLPGVDAIAVRGEHVAAVGTADALRPLAGPETRWVDAGGATVTPGITDAHVHLLPWARALGEPDLHGARDAAEAAGRLRGALDAPGHELVVARGWDESAWPAAPTRDVLDAAAPDRPVVLHRHDFHAVWFNRAAQAAAGLADDAPDPEGGAFTRDARGRLAGVAREAAARPFLALEEARLGVPGDDALDRAAARLWSEGITAVHDFHRDAATFRATSRLAGRRRLRVLQQIGLEQLEGARALGVRSGAGGAWFKVGALKLFADGTLGSRTAAMLEPFADQGGTGLDVLPARALAETVASAAAAGIATAIHAIGDRAVRHALDAFAATPAVRALALPPRIEHAQLVHPADLPRFAALGVVASVQPVHLVSDAPVARIAWAGRTPRAYPWAALQAAGAMLVAGSDAPVESPAFGPSFAAATRRLDPEGRPFHPEQALGVDAALAAWTSAPARLVGDGHTRGTLVPGALADLVVWDRDLHAAGGGTTSGPRARLTVLAGEIVHDATRPPSATEAAAVGRSA